MKERTPIIMGYPWDIYHKRDILETPIKREISIGHLFRGRYPQDIYYNPDINGTPSIKELSTGHLL